MGKNRELNTKLRIEKVFAIKDIYAFRECPLWKSYCIKIYHLKKYLRDYFEKLGQHEPDFQQRKRCELYLQKKNILFQSNASCLDRVSCG